jgi:general secretion pathway protein N
MIADRWLVGMTSAAFTWAAISGDLGLAANNPSSFDLPNQRIGTPTIGSELAAPPSAGTNIPTSRNPLWAIPLDSLSATRQRPIFLPSRRAPAPAVAAAPRDPEKPASVPVEPDRPALNLMGVVIGTTDGFAVFLNVTTRDIIRLKLGEGHDGWILRSVKGREAVLEKNHHTAVIGLPTPEEVQK